MWFIPLQLLQKGGWIFAIQAHTESCHCCKEHVPALAAFLAKWRWWKVTTRCARFDKASSAASTGAILRWSLHTCLVSPSHRWPLQLLPMPTKVSWRCELWSWQETVHTLDCCKVSYGHPTLSPCRHIHDILAVSMDVLWVWDAADLWVTQASLSDL